MGGSRRAPSGWEEDVSPLFPDAATRAAVTAEEPRLPSAYYEQSVPVPTGWDDDVACGHLLFGPPYEEMAAHARSRGWLVEELAGQHLHQLVDPEATVLRDIESTLCLPASWSPLASGTDLGCAAWTRSSPAQCPVWSALGFRPRAVSRKPTGDWDLVCPREIVCGSPCLSCSSQRQVP